MGTHFDKEYQKNPANWRQLYISVCVNSSIDPLQQQKYIQQQQQKKLKIIGTEGEQGGGGGGARGQSVFSSKTIIADPGKASGGLSYKHGHTLIIQ